MFDNSCCSNINMASFILFKHDTVAEASDSFITMTGYSKNEILNGSLDLVSEKLFKNSSTLSNLLNSRNKSELFMVKKSLNTSRIIASVKKGPCKNENIVTFIEKPSLQIENKFPFANKLCADNHLGVAIFTIPDFIVLKANQQFLSFMKAPYNSIDNLVGRKIPDFISDWQGSSTQKLLNDAIKKRQTSYLSQFSPSPDIWRDMYLDSIITPIIEDNSVKFLIVMLDDVTETVEARKSLEHLLKLKDEFLSSITHEFKTPLTVISSAIQVMELICKDEMTDKMKGFVDKIRQNTYIQMRLVNNILDFIKTKSGHIKVSKKNMDIVIVTRKIIDSISFYASQKDISLTFSSTMKKRIIAVDDEKYERILLNLLSNAIKFTPPGKSVNVTISRKNQNVLIKITDEGIGIPKDKLETIFERFGQVESSLSRRAEGTGIGLSLVKSFAQSLGGDISVKSVPGKGSTFTIILPDEKAAEIEEAATARIENSRLVKSIAIEFSDIY